MFQVSVQPSNGIEMNTTFLVLTSGWNDDPSDYPLSYGLSSYKISLPVDGVSLKTMSSVPYVSTTLSRGLQSSDYSLTCLATAVDAFGASGNASSSVRVTPVLSLLTLSTALQLQLTAANNVQDSSQAFAIIGAVASSVNTRNCSRTQLCSGFNRQPCYTTDHTCGPCLAGYIGASGDSNIPCALPAALLRNGQSCKSPGSLCLSGSCVRGACADVLKSCPNSCSGHGTCIFTSALTGNNVASCSVSDSTCSARCVCAAAYYSADCSIDHSSYSALQQMRELMCSVMLSTSSSQVVTPFYIASVSTTIIALLQDFSQVSNFALGNCTLALTDTLTTHATVAESLDAAWIGSFQALSTILNKGVAIPPSILLSVNSALQALLAARQSVGVVDDGGSSVVTENIQMHTEMVSTVSNARQSNQVSVPQSAIDSFNELPSTSIAVNLTMFSKGQAVSLTVSQIRNAQYDPSLNSTTVKLDVGTHAAVPLDGFSTVVVVQNKEPIHYQNYPASIRNVCLKSRQYSDSVKCSNGNVYSVPCKGHSQNFTCPSVLIVPQCLTKMVGGFSVDQNCKVIAYTAYNTTCSCKKLSTSRNHRKRSLSYVIEKAAAMSDPLSSATIEFASSSRGSSTPAVLGSVVLPIETTPITPLPWVTVAAAVGIATVFALSLGFSAVHTPSDQRKKIMPDKQQLGNLLSSLQTTFDPIDTYMPQPLVKKERWQDIVMEWMSRHDWLKGIVWRSADHDSEWHERLHRYQEMLIRSLSAWLLIVIASKQLGNYQLELWSLIWLACLFYCLAAVAERIFMFTARLVVTSVLSYRRSNARLSAIMQEPSMGIGDQDKNIDKSGCDSGGTNRDIQLAAVTANLAADNIDDDSDTSENIDELDLGVTGLGQLQDSLLACRDQLFAVEVGIVVRRFEQLWLLDGEQECRGYHIHLLKQRQQNHSISRRISSALQPLVSGPHHMGEILYQIFCCEFIPVELRHYYCDQFERKSKTRQILNIFANGAESAMPPLRSTHEFEVYLNIGICMCLSVLILVQSLKCEPQAQTAVLTVAAIGLGADVLIASSVAAFVRFAVGPIVLSSAIHTIRDMLASAKLNYDKFESGTSRNRSVVTFATMDSEVDLRHEMLDSNSSVRLSRETSASEWNSLEISCVFLSLARSFPELPASKVLMGFSTCWPLRELQIDIIDFHQRSWLRIISRSWDSFPSLLQSLLCCFLPWLAALLVLASSVVLGRMHIAFILNPLLVVVLGTLAVCRWYIDSFNPALSDRLVKSFDTKEQQKTSNVHDTLVENFGIRRSDDEFHFDDDVVCTEAISAASPTARVSSPVVASNSFVISKSPSMLKVHPLSEILPYNPKQQLQKSFHSLNFNQIVPVDVVLDKEALFQDLDPLRNVGGRSELNPTDFKIDAVADRFTDGDERWEAFQVEDGIDPDGGGEAIDVTDMELHASIEDFLTLNAFPDPTSTSMMRAFSTSSHDVDGYGAAADSFVDAVNGEVEDEEDEDDEIGRQLRAAVDKLLSMQTSKLLKPKSPKPLAALTPRHQHLPLMPSSGPVSSTNVPTVHSVGFHRRMETVSPSESVTLPTGEISYPQQPHQPHQHRQPGYETARSQFPPKLVGTRTATSVSSTPSWNTDRVRDRHIMTAPVIEPAVAPDEIEELDWVAEMSPSLLANRHVGEPDDISGAIKPRTELCSTPTRTRVQKNNTFFPSSSIDDSDFLDVNVHNAYIDGNGNKSARNFSSVDCSSEFTSPSNTLSIGVVPAIVAPSPQAHAMAGEDLGDRDLEEFEWLTSVDIRSSPFLHNKTDGVADGGDAYGDAQDIHDSIRQFLDGALRAVLPD